jgi:trimeric autotransporter adhesin
VDGVRRGLGGAVGDRARLEPDLLVGAPDSTRVNWQFGNSAYPMAARRDAFWIAGVEQRQVASRAQVVPGTFDVDPTKKQVVLGSDPTQATVLGSDLPRAFLINASGSSLRGLGMRRYASSVPHQGVLVVRASSVRLENLAVAYSATGGVGVFGSNNVLDHLIITGSGQLGIQGHQSDGTVVRNSVIATSNDQHFNQMPAAGGLKLTSSRGVRVVANSFSGGFGNAVWADMACYRLCPRHPPSVPGPRDAVDHRQQHAERL